jgi:intein/homing endonuclease
MTNDMIHENKVSGDPLLERLYRKLVGIDDSIRFPDTVDGCFMKGTPITTKEGWKPIEEIQVGDWVLSSPEDGSGKPEYKRVVRTFVFEDKTIRRISYSEPDGRNYSVYVTGNHPFWVEGVGWTRADILKKGNLLRLKDGGTGKVIDQFPVYQFLTPITGEPEAGIGWTQFKEHPISNPANGIVFDCANGRPVSGSPAAEMDWDDMTEENYLKVTVYNFEVEDFHTYYASSIWVHNADCAGARLLIPGNGEAPHGHASLEKMTNDMIHENKVSGDPLLERLYRKLVEIVDNIRFPDTVDGCFTKGIPITTREGWKPIEDIQVGDWVLSSPEDGSGKPEYKRVVKTFVFEDKTVRRIFYSEPDGNHSIFATGNHPFWVEGVGWTRADILKKGDLLRLKNGGTGKVTDQFPVYQFLDPISGEPDAGIGWVQSKKLPLADPAFGYLFDYANYRPVPGGSEAEMCWEDMTEENYLKVTVYNFEVEDFHTYYASDIWVHNADCAGARLLIPGNGEVPHGLARHKDNKTINQLIEKGELIPKNGGYDTVYSPKVRLKKSRGGGR